MKKHKPNIILIYTDQQRYDTLGVLGNSCIKTPNLDKLASEGVLFNNAFVTSPICVPSRISMFTGKYNHANLSYNNDRMIHERELDFAHQLRMNGYRTGLSGKDHCFGKRLDKSFDFIHEASHLGFIEPQDETEREINNYRAGKFPVPFCEDPFPPEKNITASIFRWGKEFIDNSFDQPFFLWLSIPDPHPPYMVSEPYASMYNDITFSKPIYDDEEMKNKPFRQKMVVNLDKLTDDYPTEADYNKLKSIYYGMVSYIDDEIGRLMQYLESRNLIDDTMIIFTSDHGDYLGDHKMIRKGPHLYDSLTHVPLIFSWANNFKHQVTNALVSNIDIFPTLFDIIGLEKPTDVHGISFHELLFGDKNEHRKMVFMEHGGPGTVLQPGEITYEEQQSMKESGILHLSDPVYRGRTKGVRTDKWKYCITPGDVDELYDLESDPNELRNLASDVKYKEIVSEMRYHILNWLIDTEYYVK